MHLRLVPLIVALGLLVPALTTVQMEPGAVIYTHNTTDGERTNAAQTALGCEDGVPTYWRGAGDVSATDIHELAHAWHCEQTGNLYERAPIDDFPRTFGRVTIEELHPRPASYLEAWAIDPGVSWYCWSGTAWRPGMSIDDEGPLAEAEWFACSVQRAVERALASAGRGR